MVVITAHSAGTVDYYREFDGLLMAVEFRREIDPGLTTPSL